MAACPYNVLFLCTGNSARSIIAEAILNGLGVGKVRAQRVGSQRKGRVHPQTLKLLKRMGYNIFDFRSKSWAEFVEPSAPALDFVFTVCDNAADELCPVWPGQPMTAHWGLPDPAEKTGAPAEIGLAFQETYKFLNRRIGVFNALPLGSIASIALEGKLREIGRMEGATAKVAAET